jgi:hypothetical protein
MIDSPSNKLYVSQRFHSNAAVESHNNKGDARGPLQAHPLQMQQMQGVAISQFSSDFYKILHL